MLTRHVQRIPSPSHSAILLPPGKRYCCRLASVHTGRKQSAFAFWRPSGRKSCARSDCILKDGKKYTIIRQRRRGSMPDSFDPAGSKAQSRLGAIVQMGYVVPDLERALAHWTQTLGVGPFLVTPRIDYAELNYRGRPIQVENAVALASWGGMQIEIIQQTGGDDSMFTDFIARRGGGLHHVCLLSRDLDADLAAWQAEGIGVLMGGRTAAGIPFAYLDSDPLDQGRVIEIVQPSAGLERFFARLESLAAAWDGSRPIRYL
ncbi:hypothetical protein C9E82_17320 [Paracoccus siganidrum]|uniref:VOC domain-containing protein n=2 Tax=Paracoccus siganidrum TaxID=1276757 RepID=A0A419AAU6_9RHOB|nr:hypothetical protein D3P05_03525 [Paracoccus siganidrum]RMC30757.1 hypothetical protein C9E82_17320 [Paracoccus siganidrum]